jgi:hypothetical protein
MSGMGTVEKMAVRQGGLASARDRVRLREREAAERVRVERVLARGPRDVERRRADRDSASGPASISASACGVCGVCGSGDVFEDEVGEGLRLGQGLRLAWCRRCDHRWTERLAVRFVPRFRRPSDGREVRDAGPVRRANGA